MQFLVKSCLIVNQQTQLDQHIFLIMGELFGAYS